MKTLMLVILTIVGLWFAVQGFFLVAAIVYNLLPLLIVGFIFFCLAVWSLSN